MINDALQPGRAPEAPCTRDKNESKLGQYVYEIVGRGFFSKQKCQSVRKHEDR